MSSSPSRFPDPEEFGDIVAVGGALTPEFLLDAYAHGIFPWPMEGTDELPWFCPERRAVLFFKDLHIPRSLEKARRKLNFRTTVNKAFDQVIRACADIPRPGQSGSWITPEMLSAYIELHRRGHAHSVEVWDGDELVGGIYGVASARSFAAESMFYKEDYASKIALLALIDHLKSQGLDWLDIQVMTPHMKAMGAKNIPRKTFLKLLKE